MQVLKQRTSRLLKQAGETQFWQRRYYDFNVHNPEKTTEKLRYMHRNPVKRGLVSKPAGLAMVEFSALRLRARRSSGDRVGVDCAKTGTEEGSCFPTLDQKRVKDGAPLGLGWVGLGFEKLGWATRLPA